MAYQSAPIACGNCEADGSILAGSHEAGKKLLVQRANVRYYLCRAAPTHTTYTLGEKDPLEVQGTALWTRCGP